MRRDELSAGMGGEILRPDELEMIDESVGLENVSRSASKKGMGEDLQRAHDYVLTRPRGEIGVEPARFKSPPLKPREKSKPGGPFGRSDDGKIYPIVRSIPFIPNECVVSNFRISNDKSYRVDVGLEGRTDILVANMSLSVVWVNVVTQINIGLGFVGVPLKAMSGAAAFDGGVLRLALQPNKRVWGISVAAGPNLVVSIETAIRE